MTLPPEETRWLAELRTRTASRHLGRAILFFVASAGGFYIAFCEGIVHRLPDGAGVLNSSGTISLCNGLLMANLALRALFPSPSDRLLIALIDRLQNSGDTPPLATPNPALQRTASGGGVQSESHA